MLLEPYAFTVQYGSPLQLEIEIGDLFDAVDFEPGLAEMLKIPAVREHKGCALNYQTGALSCTSLQRPPRDECRQPWCPHARLMRERGVERLRKAYALGTVRHDEL